MRENLAWHSTSLRPTLTYSRSTPFRSNSGRLMWSRKLVILSKSSRISSKRDLKNVNPILGSNRWQLSTNFRVDGHDVKHWEEIRFRSTCKDVRHEEDQDPHLKYSPGWNRRRCDGEVEVRLPPRDPHRSS